MTWAQRTERFGITPETFQAALANGCSRYATRPRCPDRSGESKRDGVKPLFRLGQLVATPGALAAIGASGDDLSTFLARHQCGDWGDVDEHDRKENQLSLEQGFRLMSG